MGWAIAKPGYLKWSSVLLVSLLISASAQASVATVVLGVGEVEKPLTPTATYLEDSGSALTLETYLAEDAQSRRQPIGMNSASLGFTESSYWFDTTVVSTGPTAIDTIVEVMPGYLFACDVWLLREGQQPEFLSIGVNHGFSARPLAHRNLLLPLRLVPGEPIRIIVRVSTQTDFWFQFNLYEETTFWIDNAEKNLGWGVYFGLMLVMVLYNLFLCVSVRSITYLYYVIYVFSFALGRALELGFGAQYYLSSIEQSMFLYGLSLTVSMVAATLFTRLFLELERHLPRLDRVLFLFTCAIGMGGTFAFIVSEPVFKLIFFMLTVVLLALWLWSAIARARQGSIEARYYLLSFSVLIVGLILVCVTILFEHAIFADGGDWFTYGSAIQVVLLSLALGRQIKTLQDENITIQREATENLQGRVEERTRELSFKTLEAQEASIEAVSAREESDRLRIEAEGAKDEANLLKVRALEDAEKLRELDKEKTRFFQNVSHELRTPLTLILNPLEQASARHAGDQSIALASRNARRLLRLVNQLLDFQKLEAGKKSIELTPVDLSKFIRVCGDYFASACSSKDVEFNVVHGEGINTEDDGVFIRGEVDALEKIAFNYLSNALKFTPSGGRVELGVELEGTSASTVKLYVRDTGPGISAEGQDKLFKVFSQVDESTTREYEGTGIGLALAKSLAEEMGAEVGVESELGKGSTFFARFEAMERPEDYDDTGQFRVREWLLAEGHTKTGEDDPLLEEHQWVGEAQRVLVVDDLSDMRALIAETLTRHGLQVMTAPHGRRGLDLARVHVPDLIVTDWMMPVMTGPELIGEIRKDAALSATPMVLLTAKSDEESKLAGTEIGADAFLGKPFNEQELTSTVRNLLALKSREREVKALNHQLTEQVLKRYLPPDLVEQIVKGDAALVEEPKSVTATILFSDIEGFTRFSGEVRAPKLARILNEYLTAMTQVIFDNGGTIDKFVGDAIMVIFGAPTESTTQEQADCAAKCALAMQTCMDRLNQSWVDDEVGELKMRIGIHQGPVVVGSFGSEIRSDYTAIGPTVNLASRIESVCLPGEVFVSGELCDFLPENMSEQAGTFEFKGISGERRLYRLLA